MTEREGGANNLTGVWHGLYTYPQINKSVSFVATLIESGSSVSGSTHEPCEPGIAASGTLFAAIVGSRLDSAVAFVKTYESASPLYDQVEYDGRLSADGTEIAGRWIIRRVWSGSFLMIRSNGQAAERTRRVAARV